MQTCHIKEIINLVKVDILTSINTAIPSLVGE